MNLDALLSPSAAKALPAGSKERSLARLAMRQLWHLVFDACPLLLKSASPDGWSVLGPFLEHAATRRLSMGWELHAQILVWLRTQQRSLDSDLARELLAAAAARWAAADLSPERGVLLRFDGWPDSAVAAWKPNKPKGPRVVELRLEGAAPQRQVVEYALLRDDDYAEASWRPLAT